MNLIATIKDQDFGINQPAPINYKLRNAARVVVWDKDGKIALIHSRSNNYYKIPGGGINDGEDIEVGLRREVLEEIGCKITNIKELGKTEEFRNKVGLNQISYCFTADVDGEKGSPKYDKEEIEDDFEPVWVTEEEVLSYFTEDLIKDSYEGQFMRKRELMIIQSAINAKT